MPACTTHVSPGPLLALCPTCHGHNGRVTALRMRKVLRFPGTATSSQPCGVLLMNTDVSVHLGALYDRYEPQAWRGGLERPKDCEGAGGSTTFVRQGT